MNTEALLQDLGVRDVLVAGNVSEAMRLVDDAVFQLAILDLRLGDSEDSLPIAERLGQKGIRFVFATGFGDAVDLAERQGAVAILKKPYRFEDLRRIIDGEFDV
ncbi:MAG: response regulator [Alphaproteobacteria bacterium]|nr:response regulator [Alphaproteobacteria bacterium]MBU0874432.1 response regulator [Alphaproteobacteria bacterium]MBU1768523.1 response regulator [Alphaproteobacteria bacterium]